ncbi:SDR family NAD(P)-dependent oxidoreductase [Nonomuraea sp. NPDC050153]|uniref:SDR family NAD(P)-dependent oxidoreductase n=1 Tax=Nonomuraea sp. NPDC050153 TaxID=3364359 RepID=UPI0037AD7B93
MLTGKVAIVTGAGQGIGRAIAIAMAKAGARVSVVDLNPATAENVAVELGEHGEPGLAIECDVSQRDQVGKAVERTVSKWGGIDILVNNAHNLRDIRRSFLDTDEPHLLQHLTSGLFGTYYFLQESYRYLKARKGSVVNVASAAGVLGLPQHFSYAATKEAIRATSRVVAKEWGPDGIRVNTICPAASETEAARPYFESLSDEGRDAYLAQLPLRRFGTADDVASVAVFLASDASGYITGHTLMVDGGGTMDAAR